MTFTSLPEMFSSVFGPLAYTFSNAAETELFLEILSTRDGSRIGSKRFYNTPTGTLNIAPMVRKNIRFVPSSGMTGFCNSESRSASVQLAVGTTYSEVRTFVAAHDSVKPSRILTTMPSHRIIAYGESDEITCCIPGQHTVTVTSDITAEALTYNAIGGEELTLFRLNTRSFLPSVGTITVRIATAGQTVAEIGYTVVPKCDEGCRIAWRSRAGSIEHYTFPVVKSVVQKIRKEQVLTDDAGYEDISIRDERTTTLASAFEPAAVIEALAEIAARLHSRKRSRPVVAATGIIAARAAIVAMTVITATGVKRQIRRRPPSKFRRPAGWIWRWRMPICYGSKRFGCRDF